MSEITPGSPGWAANIRALSEVDPSPRRVALFRVADAIRGVLHRMVQSSAPNEMIEAAAADLESVAARSSGLARPSIGLWSKKPNGSPAFADSANPS